MHAQAIVDVWRWQQRSGSGGSMEHGGSCSSLSAAATAVAEALRCQFGVVVVAAAAAWLQRQHGGSCGSLFAAGTAVTEALGCQFGAVVAVAAAAWLQCQRGGDGATSILTLLMFKILPMLQL